MVDKKIGEHEIFSLIHLWLLKVYTCRTVVRDFSFAKCTIRERKKMQEIIIYYDAIQILSNRVASLIIPPGEIVSFVC